MVITAYNVVLSFFIFVEFVPYLELLQMYCNPLAYHFRNIEVELDDGSHLEPFDAVGPGRRVLKKNALTL